MLINNIGKVIEESDFSIETLSDKMRVSQKYINDIIEKETISDVGIQTVMSLAEILNVELYRLFTDIRFTVEKKEYLLTEDDKIRLIKKDDYNIGTYLTFEDTIHDITYDFEYRDYTDLLKDKEVVEIIVDYRINPIVYDNVILGWVDYDGFTDPEIPFILRYRVNRIKKILEYYENIELLKSEFEDFNRYLSSCFYNRKMMGKVDKIKVLSEKIGFELPRFFSDWDCEKTFDKHAMRFTSNEIIISDDLEKVKLENNISNEEYERLNSIYYYDFCKMSEEVYKFFIDFYNGKSKKMRKLLPYSIVKINSKKK